MSSQRHLPVDSTQHSQQTDIHAHGGIRIHNLSRRAALDGAAIGTCDSKLYFLHYCKALYPFLFVIKPTRSTNFSNLFWNGTLHVSDSSSVHRQELFTVHSAIVYMSYRFVDSFRSGLRCSVLILLESCQQIRMTYSTAECTVNNS
jgi:hypothetical protein